MSDISPSAIETNSELERAVANAQTAEEVKALLHAAAISQKIVQPDFYDPNVLHSLLPTEKAGAAAPSPRKYGHTVRVDGKPYVIEADSSEELAHAVEEFYRGVFSQSATQQQQHVAPARNSHTDEDLSAKVELDLRFKRGEISAADYLEQSGAVADYLQKQGVSLDVLRNATEEREGAHFSQSWEQATSDFLQSPAGREWPGGQDNLKRISDTIRQMGLVDSPSADTLARAFQYMQENDLLVENPESAIAGATSHEEIRELARRASGVFGR